MSGTESVTAKCSNARTLDSVAEFVIGYQDSRPETIQPDDLCDECPPIAVFIASEALKDIERTSAIPF